MEKGQESLIKFETPSTIIGASGAGKSWLIYKILQHAEGMFTSPPKKIIYCYGVYQDLYDKMQRDIPSEQKLRSAISSWRRQLNNLLVEISDSDNIETIREKRDLFQLNFDAICTNFENLQSLKDDVKTEASKLENIEVEHQQATQNVMQRIRELDSVN